LNFVNDITERKQAGGSAAEEREKYRALLENAGESIFVVQDGNLVFSNPAYSRLVGYSLEELKGLSYTDFVHPDERGQIEERHIKRLRGEETPSHYISRIMDRAGQAHWVDINAVFISWGGRPATLDFMSDITLQKQADEALQASESRLNAIMNSAQDAVLTMNPEGNVTFWNPAAERIFATPPAKPSDGTCMT